MIGNSGCAGQWGLRHPIATDIKSTLLVQGFRVRLAEAERRTGRQLSRSMSNRAARRIAFCPATSARQSCVPGLRGPAFPQRR